MALVAVPPSSAHLCRHQEIPWGLFEASRTLALLYPHWGVAAGLWDRFGPQAHTAQPLSLVLCWWPGCGTAGAAPGLLAVRGLPLLGSRSSWGSSAAGFGFLALLFSLSSPSWRRESGWGFLHASRSWLGREGGFELGFLLLVPLMWCWEAPRLQERPSPARQSWGLLRFSSALLGLLSLLEKGARPRLGSLISSSFLALTGKGRGGNGETNNQREALLSEPLGRGLGSRALMRCFCFW